LKENENLFGFRISVEFGRLTDARLFSAEDKIWMMLCHCVLILKTRWKWLNSRFSQIFCRSLRND
jgi:hypothetical protein